ncbi:hypothetical protein M408DRAFT_301074 [Serendipita vermifera MAFF 305830]|uniref:BTB domain-containing protein n=1 Tax=Serendipita vermifera MAFF 305830 TaxID=933852 RepID=A0A0C2WWN5_SERVB|nr:hypothetical protein M408DRAFT_301074 [Serendipita vermifera MAFF 305830]
MPSQRYAIIVSGERFHFTRDQLESEPGNYFATYFFGGFQEATNNVKELILEKDPLLFKHIQTHLRGYKVFPIPKEYLPAYMDEVTALENLEKDADFFGLESLCRLTKAEARRIVTIRAKDAALKSPLPISPLPISPLPRSPPKPLGIQYRTWVRIIS